MQMVYFRRLAFRSGSQRRRRRASRPWGGQGPYLLERRTLPASIIDLGTLGGSTSNAADINDLGQVVGAASLASGASDAFLYTDGVMSDLGTLGGTGSSASGINDAGQVVGTAATTGNATSHAFLYDDGVMTDLGSLDGSAGMSVAGGINASGQLVGMSQGFNGAVPGLPGQRRSHVPSRSHLR